MASACPVCVNTLSHCTSFCQPHVASACEKARPSGDSDPAGWKRLWGMWVDNEHFSLLRQKLLLPLSEVSSTVFPIPDSHL